MNRNNENAGMATSEAVSTRDWTESVQKEPMNESYGESQVEHDGPFVTSADGPLPVADMRLENNGPSSSRALRDIKIVPLDSGYMVKVGCQSVAVETNETLISKLTEYLNDPSSFEDKWFNNSNRNKLQNN